MKKITKIMLIAAVSLVVVGGIMFGAGCLFGGIKYLKSIEYAKNDYEDDMNTTDVYDGMKSIYNKYNQGNGLVEKLIRFANKIDYISDKTTDKISNKTTKKIAGKYDMKLDKTEIKQFDSIDIDIAHLDVAFRESEDDKCYIEYNVQSRDNKNPFSYDIKDSTLYLKESKGFTAKYYNKPDVDIDLFGVHIENNIFSKYEEYNIDNMKNVIKVYIPSDKKFDNINVVMNEGDLFIMNLKFAEFNAELREGDFIAETLECDILNMQLDDGDIIISDVDCKSKLNIDMVEGDIIASSINVKSANITSDDGDIIFNDINASENIKIFSDEGDIMGSDCDISGVFNIETTEGDITINLKKNCIDKINIYVRNDEGDNMISNQFKGEKSRENGYYVYTRKTSAEAGSLNIETEDGDIMLD